MTTHEFLARLSIVFVVSTVAGCGAAVEDESREIVGESELAASVDAYWTHYVSEEQPEGVTCTSFSFTFPFISHKVAIGFECQGGYCDNVRVRCDNFPGTLGNTRWTHWVEHSGRVAECGTNEWMTGVRCWGDWCDNVSLRCSVSDKEAGHCTWTAWISEETPALTVQPGQFLRGVECDGAHCDNKRFLTCTVR